MTALLAGGAFAALVAGSSFALAEDPPSAAPEAPQTVRFTDTHSGLPSVQGPTLNLAARETSAERFAPPTSRDDQSADQPRRMEFALTADGAHTGAPLDVSISQRATLGNDNNGDLNHHGHGAEVRVGRGLVHQRDETHRGNSVYAFVSSDDQALTWRPGSRSEFGGSGASFALQDQVQIGDRSAGVTYEHNGVQASLAYVERKQTTRVGRQNFDDQQNFAGVTVTMRH